MIKIIVIIAFLLIIFSLGTALYNLVRTKDVEQSAKTLKALTFRIGLSVLLFVFVAIALKMGWFRPEGIGARMEIAKMQQHAPKTP
jgi:hypothetical protein